MYERNVNTEGSWRTGSAVSICSVLRQNPHATAVVRGSSDYPQINGRVKFYQMRSGVLVAAEIFGLPEGRIMPPMPGGGMMPQNPSNSMPPQRPENPRPPQMPGNAMNAQRPPQMPGRSCRGAIFGFHIHSGSQCGGNMQDPFADAGEHYNPNGCMHPYHAGDMPPLFGNNGYAFQIFLTDRFTVNDIIGKTVIIHSEPDDFRTQPGGNSGSRIACGQILGRETRR